MNHHSPDCHNRPRNIYTLSWIYSLLQPWDIPSASDLSVICLLFALLTHPFQLSSIHNSQFPDFSPSSYLYIHVSSPFTVLGVGTFPYYWCSVPHHATRSLPQVCTWHLQVAPSYLTILYPFYLKTSYIPRPLFLLLFPQYTSSSTLHFDVLVIPSPALKSSHEPKSIHEDEKGTSDTGWFSRQFWWFNLKFLSYLGLMNNAKKKKKLTTLPPISYLYASCSND